MSLGMIFAILLISMLVFSPFVILFYPTVQKKINWKNKDKE